MNPWKNKDNAQFYDLIPPGTLQDIAIQAGLDTCCDVDLIRPYIDNANSILEIGAGYGRVIENILTHGYKGKLTALERCQKFYQLLQSRFDSNQVNLLYGDIQEIQLTEKFDLILFLWSGFAEFIQTEQAQLITKLFTYLKKDRYLIIDMVPTSIKPVNTLHHTDKNWTVYVKNNINCKCHIYMAPDEEMLNYAHNSNIHSIQYITPRNRQRILYILQK